MRRLSKFESVFVGGDRFAPDPSDAKAKEFKVICCTETELTDAQLIAMDRVR